MSSYMPRRGCTGHVSSCHSDMLSAVVSRTKWHLSPFWIVILMGLVSALDQTFVVEAVSLSSKVDRLTNAREAVMLGEASVNISHFASRLQPTTTQIKGYFSVVGKVTSAYGKPQQIHPCHGEDFSMVERPWVAIYILENATLNCPKPFKLVNNSVNNGAIAVILHVMNNPQAAKQLSIHRGVVRVPVIIVDGPEAQSLGQLIKYSDLSASTIYISQHLRQPPMHDGEAPNLIIFIFVGLVLFIIIGAGIGILVKFKCPQQSPPPHTEMDQAKGMLSKMGTQKFMLPDNSSEHEMDQCAICLEEYKNGQELRILPCGHGFHKNCVDGWMISKQTCPLCCYNILTNRNEAASSHCASPVTGNQTGNLVYPRHPAGPAYSPLSAYSMYSHGDYQTGRMFQTMYPSYVPVPMSNRAGHHNHNTPQYSDFNHPFSRVANMLPLTSPTGIMHPHARPYTTLANPCVQRNLSGNSKKAGNTSGNSRRRSPARLKKSANLRSSRHIAHDNHPLGEAPASSSESEYDYYQRSTAQRNKPQHYQSTNFDADVSEQSTGVPSGVESDTPRLGSSSSHVDLSNKSVFGSSEVPSDVTSFDSYVYGDSQQSVVQSRDKAPQEVGKTGVHLWPVCMVPPNKKTRRKAVKSSYSVIGPPNTCNPNSPRSALPGAASRWRHSKDAPEDSDQSVSSVDTSGLSPQVSGWSHSSSGSDNNADTSPSQQLPKVSDSSQSAATCAMCAQCQNSRGYLVPPPYLPEQATVLHERSERTTCFLPTAVSRDTYSRQQYTFETFPGRPPGNSIPSRFFPYPMSSALPSTSFSASGVDIRNAQVTTNTQHPHLATTVIQNAAAICWNFATTGGQDSSGSGGSSGQELGPQFNSGGLSKAGSTCSFYCYPSNQPSSSSASSSPLHLHSSEGSGDSDGNKKTLVVQTNNRGEVSTRTLNSHLRPLGNVV